MISSLFASQRANGTETQSSSPCVVWRNPVISPGLRQTTCRRSAPHAPNYEVLEKRGDGLWYLVAVFTVIDRVRS